MSIHKLTAGSGYDYLTRQVAAMDATHKGHVGLATYYTERGETPGVWVGQGMNGLVGLAVGDTVTAEQMQLLFGEGRHPLAGPANTAVASGSMSLGLPFRTGPAGSSTFDRELAARFAAENRRTGRAAGSAIDKGVRARIRSEVGREFFRVQYGRNPADARELSGMLARLSRSPSTAVAGYDLTFSPVKSVSTLWAVADQRTAATIERAHQAAVGDALRFIEQHALFTRQGAGGIRQVDVRGLIAAAFTHRDSRAGDPDLHTHVAVANKVQTRAGKWLAIDGRVLFAATVAASETYNTALEHHLTSQLSVQFGERAPADPRKRPIREIIGVDPTLNTRWSARRRAIATRQGELATRFQHDHGRPPTNVEALQLGQQATLETRDAKHEPRTLTEQRATWHTEAVDVLGSDRRLQRMIHAALQPTPATIPAPTAEWVTAKAITVLAKVEKTRSTWQIWHLRAEALRQVRAVQLPDSGLDAIVDQVVSETLRQSVALRAPDDGVHEPVQLRRADGSSVYTVAGADLYTSTRVLNAEQQLLATAQRTDGWTIDPSTVDLALLEAAANGTQLDSSQTNLVREMATSGSRLQLAVAPAGAGKTTALHALTRAWTDAGGTVLGLAPSAAAAAQLGEQTRAPADTLARLTWALDHHQPLPDWAQTIGPRTLVLIDEVGMADTLTLNTAVGHIVNRGGSVRLVGDDAQLTAIGAGGVLRDLRAAHGAIRLTDLHRFADSTEAAATLALRDGHTEALGFYLDHHRIHVGDPTTITGDILTAWRTDRDRGLDALMLAPTRDQVADLNRQARAARLGTTNPSRELQLPDGNWASAGDLVITRRNDRRLRTSSGDWVKNGDRWTIHDVTRQGELRVRHRRTGRVTTLPAHYVREFVELGYAITIHAAQGVTADTMHGLITGGASRQQLYTMVTRGRTANHLYLPVAGDGDPHSAIHPSALHPSTATELLERILDRDDSATSATTHQRNQQDPERRLSTAVSRYLDALQAAAEDTAAPHLIAALDGTAERIATGLTSEPAWPTLRAHLLLQAAHGADPAAALSTAAARHELDTASDRAAVIDSRLASPRSPDPGPLPWLPPPPRLLMEVSPWGDYIGARAQLITALAEQVRSGAVHRSPAWATQAPEPPPATLIGDIQVWRAATGTDPLDPRPTGPAATSHHSLAWQQQLDHRLNATTSAGRAEIVQLITDLAPTTRDDPYTTVLATRLANLAAAGIDGRQALERAAAVGPLPDDHPAAALWWRTGAHLPKVDPPPRMSRDRLTPDRGARGRYHQAPPRSGRFPDNDRPGHGVAPAP